MDNQDLLNNELQVTPRIYSYLNETSRWGKFLSIIGFICCGFMVILAFILPSIYMHLPVASPLPEGYAAGMKVGLTIVYLVLAVILFFPCMYLYKFSTKMQIATKELNQETFDESFMNLKALFKFYGIFTIVMLSIYALVLVVSIIGVATRQSYFVAK